jgi:hypothetical protein
VVPAAPAGTPRDLNTLLTIIQGGGSSDAEKTAALLELEGHVGTNRQAVVNTLLNELASVESSMFITTPRRLATAVSVLKKINAAEAKPFFQALLASPYGRYPEVRGALDAALSTAATPAAPGVAAAAATGPSFEALEARLRSGASEAEKVQAMMAMEPMAATNRQGVVNALLHQLRSDSALIYNSPRQITAAISVLRALKAKEAVPFIQALLTNSATSAEVRQAGQQALTEFGAATPAAAPAATPATPAAPAAATPATPAAPAVLPTAPAATTVPATPATPAAPGQNIPSFLRK